MPKRLRPSLLSLLLLSGLAMSGCATSAGEPGYLPGQAVTLHPGGRVALPDGASLRYIGVAADSRCPPGAQCIRAGDADVRFEFSAAAGQAQALTLNVPGRRVAEVGGWRVEMLQLAFGEAPPVTVRVDSVQP